MCSLACQTLIGDIFFWVVGWCTLYCSFQRDGHAYFVGWQDEILIGIQMCFLACQTLIGDVFSRVVGWCTLYCSFQRDGPVISCLLAG